MVQYSQSPNTIYTATHIRRVLTQIKKHCVDHRVAIFKAPSMTHESILSFDSTVKVLCYCNQLGYFHKFHTTRVNNKIYSVSIDGGLTYKGEIALVSTGATTNNIKYKKPSLRQHNHTKVAPKLSLWNRVKTWFNK